MHKGHGNTHAQQKRRRKNLDLGLYRDEEYVCIDGNITHYPYAWCDYHKGYLTKNLAARHNCEDGRKECSRLKNLPD